MKNLSLVLASWLAVSAMAWANELEWKVNWGVYTHEATDLVTDFSGAILDSHDVLWQLIYAGANNAIDPVDVDNAAQGYVSGDDEVLASRRLSRGNSDIFDNYLYTEDDAETASSLSYAYSEENPYAVYQRIYESRTPAGGTYYYESELVKLDSEYASGSQTFALGPEEEGIKANHRIPGIAPDCCLDICDGGEGAFHIQGWAYDPDAASQSIDIHIHLYADAGCTSQYGDIRVLTANVPRPDVNQAFGITGAHGFLADIPVADAGTYWVKFFAIDATGNGNPQIGAPRSVTVKATVPPQPD